MPDPLQQFLSGLPLAPSALGQATIPTTARSFPLEPLDRDPTDGLRHGFVQTASGRFGFRVTDMALPSRVPLVVGRVYDAGLLASLPGVPIGYEPRMSRDLGPNWILQPTSALLPTPTGFLLLTDLGAVVPYVLDPATGKYFPAPDRPSEFGPMAPNGQGAFKVRMSNGRLRTYTHLSGDANYYLTKEEDVSGNAINLSYRVGEAPETLVYLERIDSTDGHWIRFDRPMWGASAPPSVPRARIVAIVDSTGRTVSPSYDSAGQLLSATGVSGATWTYDWDAAKHITEITDPLGRRAFDLTTDGSSRTTRVEHFTVRTDYAYEAARTLVSNVLSDTWIYEKDAKGCTTRLVDPEGNATVIVRDAVRADVTQITDGAGGVHLFEHDTGHRLTRYQAPAVGGQLAVWTFTWDSAGRLVRSVNPLNAASVLAYDTAGRLISEATDEHGDGTAEIVTQYQRDPVKGDILAVIVPVGAGVTRRTEFSYGPRGELTAIRPPALAGGTIQPEIRLEWNAAGRMTKLRWPTGPGAWSDWQFGWAANGAVASTANPLDQQWTYVSDALGAITEVQAPNGGVAKYFWRADGQLERHEDAAGGVTQRDFDTAGRLWRVIDPSGAAWIYAWDGADRLASKTDPESRTTHFTYDGANRLIEQELPGGALVTQVWDAAGRLARRELPGGETEYYTWDLANQLVEARQVVADGDATVEDRWTWTWDGRGLPLEMKQWLRGASAYQMAEWEWDLAGQLTSWTALDDGLTTVTRDAWGRPTTIAGPSGVASQAAYDPWSGWVTYRKHGAGPDVFEEWLARDVAGRIVDVVERKNGSTPLQDAVLTRDAMGLVTQSVDLSSGVERTTTYGWDILGRLVSEERTGDPATDYSATLAWDRLSRLVGRRQIPASGAPSERFFRYDRIGRPLEVTGSAGIQVFDWEDSPVGIPAASRARRLDFGSSPRTVEIELDADRQVRRVFDLSGAVPAERRRLRWAPGGRGRAVESRSWNDTGQPTADVQYLQDLDLPSRGYSQVGGGMWRLGDLALVAGADEGDWRQRMPGRRFAERDDLRSALGRAGLASAATVHVIGGLSTSSGLRLPEAALLAKDLAPDDLPSAERSRRRAGLPEPAFLDDEWGFPGAASPVQKTNATYDPGMRCWHGTNMGKNACPAGLSLTQVSETPTITPCYATEPDCRGGGRAESSEGFGPGFSHPQEPIRNADTHPLGVTLSNGNFMLTVNDLVIPGRGLDLVLTRTFRSQSFEEGAIGRGWSLSYIDQRLRGAPGSTGSLVLADGAFVPVRVAEAGFTDNFDLGKLRRIDARNAEWRALDGTVTRFYDPDGKDSGLFAGRPKRITRPGATPITLDWSDPPPSCNRWSGEVLFPTVMLWSCDDDSETNPVGAQACAPTEIGRLTFEAAECTAHEGPRLQSVLAEQYERQINEMTVTHSRRITFGNDTATNLPGQIMVTHVEGSGPSQVARYVYSVVGGQFELTEIRDGADDLVMTITYTDPHAGAYLADRVREISTPDANGDGTQEATRFSYEFQGRDIIGRVTVQSGDRSSVHAYDALGHMTSVTRPDNLVMLFEYDFLGRMSRATYPSGRVQRWVYGTDQWGHHIEHPIKFGEIASSALGGGTEQWTCYEIDPVTNEVWRTLAPSGVTGGENDPCVIRDANGLKPQATETVFGWMKAAPGADLELAAYFTRWEISPPDGAYVGDGTAKATWPWLAKVEETGRGADQVVDADGAVVTQNPVQRPVTRYTYSVQGLLTQIDHPDTDTTDAGKGVTRESFTYWAPNALGTLDGDGSATELGRPASHVVEDQDGSGGYTERSHTRTTYDRWGQAALEARLLDASGGTERWVVSETTRDFRGRTTRERQVPKGGTGPSTGVEYHYDGAGRVLQKRIDTTRDPAAAEADRTYALVEYVYGASGLLTGEKSSETASAGSSPWTASGPSAERRFSHDAFGHVVQEATRLAPGKWKIDRASFDRLDRPERQEAYAVAWDGAEPPAPGTTLSGDRVAHQFWYNATTGLLDWEQIRGEGSSSKVTSTIFRAYDGHERVREEALCQTPGNVGGLPTCGAGNWLRQTLAVYDVEDRVTLRKVHGTPNEDASILSWEETSYDTRGRAYESRTRRSKTGPTIPISCTGDAVCEVLTSRVGYDVRDRAVVTAAPGLTDTTWRITKTTYDGLGRRRQITDPLDNVTTLTRNAAGLATARTEQEGSGPEASRRTWTTEFGFDALGRAVEVRLKGKQDADPQRIVKRTLDARGLTTAQWTPLGSASAGDAYSTKTFYDGLGRKTEEWRHLGASQTWSGAWQKVLYTFDDAGRMTTLTVPNTASGTGLQNQITEFAYDAQGRRTKRCLPDFRQELSAYLSSGQLSTLTVTSAGTDCGAPGTKQIVQTSTWDDAGRRTQLTLTTPTTDVAHYGGTKKQTWAWDALDRLEKSTDENAEGTANADDDAIVRYKYDSLGRPLEEGFGESSDAARWKVLSAYDRRGARISLKYPAANGTVGTTLTLTADDLGRLTQVAEGGTCVAALTHVGAGRLAKIASQDGSLWEGLDWDAAGRRGRGKVTLGGATQFEEEIAFDDDDRVLSVKWPHLVDSGRPQVQQYTYDEQARLLKVEQGYGTWNGTETKWTFTQYSSFHDFRLDEQGNWAQHQDGAGATFVNPTIAKDNAYTAWPVSGGSLSFVLDDAGRFVYERPVAGGGKYLYKHDGLGRLVSAQRISVPGKADLTTSYGYTADGRLAWRKEGAAAREWLIYDGSQAVVQTTDSALSWTHVWAGSRLVRTTKHPAGTVYHPHQDRLGSIVVITRSGGPDRALYDPYGRLVAAFSTITNDTFPIPYGYAGARWEATAGLYQMGARWYDPELGRFIEQDPIGEAGGLNLYAYVGSSPTLWVDPTGLAREGVGGSVIGRGPVNRTSQRQIVVDGMSTSDMLTGSSGGWLDWGSSHQTDYAVPSFDLDKDQRREAKKAAKTAIAAAESGEVGDSVDAIALSLHTGASLAAGDSGGAAPSPEKEEPDASPAQNDTVDKTKELIDQTRKQGNEIDKKQADALEEEMKRERIRTVVSPQAGISIGPEDSRRTIGTDVKGAHSHYRHLKAGGQNPKWTGGTYEPKAESETVSGDRWTVAGVITIYQGTHEVTRSSMTLENWTVRVFAHEAVHALARLRSIPHNQFPAGIWMGAD